MNDNRRLNLQGKISSFSNPIGGVKYFSLSTRAIEFNTDTILISLIFCLNH